MIVTVGESITALYLLSMPTFVPKLLPIVHDPWYTARIRAAHGVQRMNLVTDSVFIAYRSAKYNLLIDGVIQSATKLFLPLALVGLGAYGIFASSGLAAAVAVGASLYFMVRVFGYHPGLVISREVVSKVWAFSAVNYLANLLNIIPTLVLPVLVLDGRGAAEAGFFYVAFQIANLLNTVNHDPQSLFAEGSYDGASLRSLAKRSGWIQVVTLVPTTAALVVATPLILSFFGHAYHLHSTSILEVLLASAPAVAFNTWTSSLMRLTRQLGALLWSNVVYAVVLCGLAGLWVHRGLVWVGVAWLVGNLVSGVVGALALLFPRGEQAHPMRRSPCPDEGRRLACLLRRQRRRCSVVERVARRSPCR